MNEKKSKEATGDVPSYERDKLAAEFTRRLAAPPRGWKTALLLTHLIQLKLQTQKVQFMEIKNTLTHVSTH